MTLTSKNKNIDKEFKNKVDNLYDDFQLYKQKFNQFWEKASELQIVKNAILKNSNQLNEFKKIIEQKVLNPHLVNKEEIINQIKEYIDNTTETFGLSLNKKVFENKEFFENEKQDLENLFNNLSQSINSIFTDYRINLDNIYNLKIKELDNKLAIINQKIEELHKLIEVEDTKYNQLLANKNPSYAQINLNTPIGIINYNDSILKILDLGPNDFPDTVDDSGDFEIVEINGKKLVKVHFNGKLTPAGIIKLKNNTEAGGNYHEVKMVLKISTGEDNVQYTGFVRKESKKFKIGDITVTPKILNVKSGDLLDLKIGRLEGKSTIDVGLETGSYLNFKRVE